MRDFKIDFYPEQFKEALYDASGNTPNIFEHFSYINPFLHQIPRINPNDFNCFMLLYNFNYIGEIVKTEHFIYFNSFDFKL